MECERIYINGVYGPELIVLLEKKIHQMNRFEQIVQFKDCTRALIRL